MPYKSHSINDGLRAVRTALGDGRTTLIGVDPDSTHPAWALWDGSRLVMLGGGTSARPDVPATLRAFCDVLEGCGQVAGVAVEHPSFWGAHTTPASMEGVYRARYYVEAACEISHLSGVCVPVPPSTWQARFLRGEKRGRARGGAKRAYQAKVDRLWPGLARNEDQRAALGVLWWLARETGVTIPTD